MTRRRRWLVAAGVMAIVAIVGVVARNQVKVLRERQARVALMQQRQLQAQQPPEVRRRWNDLARPTTGVSHVRQPAGRRPGRHQDDTHLLVVERLRQFFEVAHLHFNNASCTDDLAPFPTWAYESWR